jgi:predicted PurR-regulated permease PerM
MPFFETNHERAALLLLLLGLALAIALTPYATGLLGIPVLYVVFAPVHAWLRKHVGPQGAATLVVVLVVFVIVVPGVSFAGLVVNQAQQIGGGVLQNPLLGRLSALRIGTVDVGAELANLGGKIVSWIGSSAFGLIGTATRLALNLTISLFGLFYLLLRPGETWTAVQPYIPFSPKNTEKLRARFRDVTTSTIIGTGLTAAIQGALLSLAFWVIGLPDAVFWGVVTMVFAILPLVGSGLVWGPAAIILLLDHRYTAAVGLALWGVLVVGNVEFAIRPMVFRRWAHIHPLITLVGALAGLPYFGLLGLLIGPLALSYFFELLKMYREEYLT